MLGLINLSTMVTARMHNSDRISALVTIIEILLGVGSLFSSLFGIFHRCPVAADVGPAMIQCRTIKCGAQQNLNVHRVAILSGERQILYGLV